MPDEAILLGTREADSGNRTIVHVPFGISDRDRRSHTYVIGQTGTGKTNLLRNILLQDIARGAGAGIIDPHGDIANDELLDHIPAERINDVCYFHPADLERPVAMNLVSTIPPDDRPALADALTDAFSHIFPSWGDRLHWILYNSIRACLDVQDATLLSIPKLLVDDRYRNSMLRQVRDPMVTYFWQEDFNHWDLKFRRQAIISLQDKLGRFLAHPATRNIFGQPQNKINFREIMDRQLIFVANLAKGPFGPDQAHLLGSLLVAQFQIAAMKRATMPEDQRRDFFLIIDEFQNFMTDSFAGILSECRKYRLNLTLANQLTADLRPKIKQAILGNAGTIISFRVGVDDAALFERVMGGQYKASEFLDLALGEVIAKIQQSGKPGNPFHGHIAPRMDNHHGREEQIITESRRRYTSRRHKVETQIAQLFTPERTQKEPTPVG